MAIGFEEAVFNQDDSAPDTTPGNFNAERDLGPEAVEKMLAWAKAETETSYATLQDVAKYMGEARLVDQKFHADPEAVAELRDWLNEVRRGGQSQESVSPELLHTVASMAMAGENPQLSTPEKAFLPELWKQLQQEAQQDPQQMDKFVAASVYLGALDKYYEAQAKANKALHPPEPLKPLYQPGDEERIAAWVADWKEATPVNYAYRAAMARLAGVKPNVTPEEFQRMHEYADDLKENYDQDERAKSELWSLTQYMTTLSAKAIRMNAKEGLMVE